MTRTFHVIASGQRRTLSHILQALESQMARIRSFSGNTNGIETSVTVVFSSDQDKAHRTEASSIVWRMCAASPNCRPRKSIANTLQ
jgi:hypothetical protein